jgi:hypothetical protein
MKRLLLEFFLAALSLKATLSDLWARTSDWISVAFIGWIINILTPRWKPWDLLQRRVEQAVSAQAEPINLHFEDALQLSDQISVANSGRTWWQEKRTHKTRLRRKRRRAAAAMAALGS